MSGAVSVLALVLLQWTAGWLGGAAWTQSWKVVKRGHFRITAWLVAGVALATFFSVREAVPDGAARSLAPLIVVLAAGYLAAQFVRSEQVASIVGGLGTGLGLGALLATMSFIAEWPDILAGASLVAGAVLLGGVTNGMMLGHWYLNQPGLKPWALARLTQLTIVGVVASGVLGLVATPLLVDASTEGAVLGLPGLGDDFAVAFSAIWLVLLGFTAWVVWAARRCIQIRSIQSATGLYYVAILTAGVSEFLLRYLMVNAT